jgi:hypothetical protein
VRYHSGRIVDHAVDLAGDEIGHRRRRTAIWDMRHVDTGGVHQQRLAEMTGGADAGRSECELAGLGARDRDQFA